MIIHFNHLSLARVSNDTLLLAYLCSRYRPYSHVDLDSFILAQGLGGDSHFRLEGVLLLLWRGTVSKNIVVRGSGNTSEWGRKLEVVLLRVIGVGVGEITGFSDA